MDELLLFIDRESFVHKLTIKSPQSHYGLPVYRKEDNSPYDSGPADMVDFAGLKIQACQIVALWAKIRGRSKEEMEFAGKFLIQNPDFLKV